MGNRIARKSTATNRTADRGVVGLHDIQLLHENGRKYLQDLQSKLSKTESDRSTLEQELNTARTWLDRVESGNTELLVALTDARNATGVLACDLEVKKQRVLALEAEIESLKVRIHQSDSAAMGSGLARIAPFSTSPAQVENTRSLESDKDLVITKYQKEVADLKLELRKKDRNMRKEMRRQSNQLHDVDISKDWRDGEDSLMDAASNKTMDKSMEILFRTHKAALNRADQLIQVLQSINSAQQKDSDKVQRAWQKERSDRRECLESMEFRPRPSDTHINLSLVDISDDKDGVESDSAGDKAAGSRKHSPVAVRYPLARRPKPRKY